MSDRATNDPVLEVGEAEKTTVGNYFVANYPPFSFWRPEHVVAAEARLHEPPEADTPFGLYLHIPFCRKRCDFCYFRVYTDNDAERVRRYIAALVAELKLYAELPFVRGRRPEFVYFGGGTPSYLSADQLRELFEGLQEVLPWDGAKEITFECEPGTLQEKKIRTLRELGVTRLSLGVENFDAEILELNNRAHRAKEIDRAYGFARDAGFPQINIDLIAGMVGETDANWQRNIERTRELAPESVTAYQMEVPYNTTVYKRMKDGEQQVAPVADWTTKRRWVSELFDGLAQDGYLVGSAYTAKRSADVEFRYRDGLWHGADMLGLGVSSFGHVGGVHVQNEPDLDPWFDAIEAGRRPLKRALPIDADQRLIREFSLQLKIGRLDTRALADKFGVDVVERFRDGLEQHRKAGLLEIDGTEIVLSRDGLLLVDRLLPAFFQDQHRDARYT